MLPLLLGYGCSNLDELSQESPQNATDKAKYLKYLHEEIASKDQLSNRSSDYSSSEAVDFLNEGLNLMYCRPDTSYAESLFYLDTITMSYNGSGRIDEADLESALGDIAEFAGSKYHAEVRSDKIPVMFNVRQISGSILNCEIEATFVMEAGANSLQSDLYPYEFEWIYGQWEQDVSGECNEEEVNADAADLFRRDLRRALLFRKKTERPYYFKNPFTVCFSPSSNSCVAEEIPLDFFPADTIVEGVELLNDDDPMSYDNFNDFLLFHNYSGSPDYHDCISVDEMNFHYDSMYVLIQGVLPNPSGYNVITQIEIGYEWLAASEFTIFHSMVVSRAQKVTILHEELEEAILLPIP
ncbi:MAG TPA: hypothetical protein VGK46_04725 [Saprospiraceae bacterium]